MKPSKQAETAQLLAATFESGIMILSTIYRNFYRHAKSKRMDVTGNADRFFSLTTARAWTQWLEKHRPA